MIDWIRKLVGPNPATIPAEAPVAAPPAPALNLNDERLPKSARELAAAISERIERLLNDTSHTPLEQAMLSELATMRDVHLPKLLRSYIGIPPEHRKEIFKQTGRSASYLLEETLGQMGTKVEAISRDLAQNDINAFANNAEFVSRRYGRVEDPFA